MPDPKDFLDGFNLRVGFEIAGYKCIKANANHVAIKMYHEYEYYITLSFKRQSSNANYHELYHYVLDLSYEKKTIYGVRNPYRCNIDPVSDDNITGTLMM